MEDGVSSDSEKYVTPAAKAVEAGCPICLESFKDKAFVDVCFHTFCFACILQWADVVSSCPMCKVPFKSIIHNVRGVDTYDQHEIKPKPVLVSQEVSLAEARRFWYRTTRLTSTRKSHKDNPARKRSVPHGRDVSAQKRRKAVYAANLWVKPQAAQQGVKKIRETNAHFYKSNPAATHRLMPWLTREFQVIIGEENTSFMVALVNSMLSKHDITSSEFADNLRPFLFEQTEHFVHEFVSFARSPYDMVAYDDKAEYDVPPDGSQLPELLPMENDDVPGPSTISSSQQMMLDNLDDHDVSPNMKQCRGEDDTSSGSSHAEEEQESREKDERRGSHSQSMVHRRDHSRDNGDKRISHRDHYSRSRKMYDHYDSKDRRDSSSRYSNTSSRHHSHHRRRHHGYSSSSSTERHSHKRRRRSSTSTERHHSDKHRSRRKDKKRSTKSDRRRRSSSTAGRKKRRHHHNSSCSNNSPVRNCNDIMKSHDHNEVTKKGDSLKQAPDEVLEEELVNLETQISMDKKMLLKNLLRKERLELLHESLEKEQVVDESLTNSDDSKLKEELQQLDEAIATGKNALIKVMKRIGSTEGERNTTEQ